MLKSSRSFCADSHVEKALERRPWRVGLSVRVAAARLDRDAVVSARRMMNRAWQVIHAGMGMVSGYCAEWNPGSEGPVLANRLGITDPPEIEEEELELPLQLYEQVLPTIAPSDSITSSRICE